MNYVFNIAEFKNYYLRDFPFQPATDPIDLEKYIQDSDIERARLKAKAYYIDCGFSPDVELEKIALFAIVAHCLCVDIKNSMSGINSKFEWPSNSKSVGSVSTSSAIPQKLLNDPYYIYLTSTGYGYEYLLMILPCTVGGIFVVGGATTP